MPFKSEKQRKYLWANEPEIARDWTDTYGSGIQAAQGGIIGSVGGISRPKYQQGNMVGAEMEGAMMQSQEVIKELYDALIAQGLSPQEAMKQIKELLAATQAEEPQSPMMGEEFPGQEFGRTPAAFGGIMDTYTGRRKYGIGSKLKKAFGVVTEPVKKVLKKVKKLASSKFGKIALGYLAGAGLAGWGARNMQGFLNPGTFAGNISKSWTRFAPQILKRAPNTLSTAASENIGAKSYANTLLDKAAGELTGRDKLFLEAMKPKSFIDKIPGGITTAIAVPSLLAGAAVDQQQPEELGGEVTAEYDDNKAWWDNYLAGLNATYDVNPSLLKSAQGGRVGRQEGGLMNLGGLEKDYRNDGGFVPIGGQEKADDVPARLSRNEFVFTADAVRNAGGGDIDRGAEVMENVMKNLEGGGKISEESQGQGAQEMFEVSERLSEVV